MNMKVENEVTLSTVKLVTVMLLEPYAGKLARTVLRGEPPRKGADLLDSSISYNSKSNYVSIRFLYILITFAYKSFSEKLEKIWC